MKRWSILLGIAALMAVAAVSAERWLNKPKRLRARYHQVQLGMTKGEAVAIMGEGKEVVFTQWDKSFVHQHAPDATLVGYGSTLPVGEPSMQRTDTYHFVVDQDSIIIQKWIGLK